MIKEDYVSFEIAKLLKEKGFDEECRAYWDSRIDDLPKEYEIIRFTEEPIHQPYDNMHSIRKRCLAPTHQMAMKWLREVHNIFIVIDRHYFVVDKISHIADGFKYSIEIKTINTVYTYNDYKSYEEAVEAACIYALKNLL